ncbi:MAG TPA: DHHA1 domain-containing protein, partial [Candidatus Saccharimonadales bacterium]|nr:DHHA1 domain-containing protein [Candidatus Saccharimonadales bacterium]
LFKDLNLKQPDGYAQVTMAGLFADTGGLVYIKPGQHREVFRLTDELVSGGANIEEIANQLSRFSEDDMKMLAELASNTTHDGDYTYSFIRDEVIDSWHRQGKTHAELQKPTGAFLDDYIRNIGGREWGFIVYKNILQGQGMYSVSLRSVDGIIDVSVIASDLGGGGHKPAAGAKFQAGNINDAVSKVKEVIKTHKPTT